MFTGIAALTVPPTDNPLVKVAMDLRANRDSFSGREIIPDYMRGLEPSAQYNEYSSEFSKKLGALVNVSPLVIDHAVTGLGGSWARNILKGSNAIVDYVDGEERVLPEAGYEDYFVLQRFIKNPYRSTQSSADFWDEMSQSGGTLAVARNTYKDIAKSGDVERAVAYVNRQPDHVRDFIILTEIGTEWDRRLHPMIRAENSMRVISSMRRQIRDGNLRRQGTEQVYDLNRHQLRTLNQALEQLQALEAVDALALMEYPGYPDAPRVSRRDIMNTIALTDRDVAQELQNRMFQGSVMPYDVMVQNWNGRDEALRRYDNPQTLAADARMLRYERLSRE